MMKLVVCAVLTLCPANVSLNSILRRGSQLKSFGNFRSEISEVLRELLRNLSSNEKERIANEVQYAVREFFPGGHMRFPAQMIIVSGTKRS